MNQKYRPSAVTVWFLDEDLQKSAEYLTNFALMKSIDGCFSALVCTRMYFIGIRNKKAYEYYFGRDRKQETMDRFFPCWPFRNRPAFKTYTLKITKWTRQCREHYEYILSYLAILFTEYEFRNGRRHKLAHFMEWLETDAPALNIPYAHLKQIFLPWKALKQKFRRKDILEGFRLQFMDTFCWGDPMKAYVSSSRDVPEFVIKYYHLDTAAMVT